MRKPLFYSFVLILSTVLITALLFVPPRQPTVYWGAWIDGVPWDPDKLNAFETMVDKQVSIIHYGQPWQMDGKYQPFHPEPANAVRKHGAIPLINWTAFHVGYGPKQPDYRLAEIISGRYDEYIREWARGAKGWGHPYFLKLNHEMNGSWQFPWSEQLNGNKPGEYVKAWRHIHDIFTEVGATNATWVWCPNVVDPKTTPLDSLYPGDNYVDWTCLHGYNFGDSDWRTFSDVFSGNSGNRYNSYQQLLDLAPSKPIMLGEWASAEAWDDSRKKALWIRDALAVQIPKNYPQIKAVVWFNWNAEEGRSWLVESSPAATEAFRAAIASPYYAENTFGNITESPILPLQ